MLGMDFEALTMFLQQDLCNISSTDDQFFINIQKDLTWLRNSNLIADNQAPSYASAPVPLKSPKTIPNKASDASTSSYDNVQKTSRPLENYTKPEKKSPRPLEEYVKRRKSETRLKSPPSSPPGPQQRPLNVKPTSPKTYSSPDATRRIEIKIAEKMKSDQDFQPVTEWARKYSRHRTLEMK